MEAYSKLAKAPIIEALIDIQVKPSPNTSIDVLDIHEEVKSKYSKKEELHQFTMGVEIKEGKPSPPTGVTGTRRGFRYISSDERFVFQSRIDGFTLSRLKQYDTWEELRDEGRSLWNIYMTKASKPLITRVALRYINKIMIPLPVRDFADYFTTPPVVPQKLPQGVSSFFNRIMIHDSEINASAIITHAMESVSGTGAIPIILDIDVFKSRPEGLTEDEAWESLGNIRDFKNKIFYNLITDRLKEMLK